LSKLTNRQRNRHRLSGVLERYMRKYFAFCALATGLAFTINAATPPPEKLLPADTLAVITVPDYTKAVQWSEKSASTLFWKDPAMKPFKDKFINKFNKDIVAPLEKELGIKFSDYTGLAEGQITFAIVKDDWEGKSDVLPGWVVILDSGSKSEQLKKVFGALKAKWVDSGKQIKTEKIRDVEFTTLVVMSEDVRRVFEKVFPDPSEGWESLDGPKKKRPNTKIEIMAGQSGSLFMLSGSAKTLQKVLSLQAGGGSSTLADNPVFLQPNGALLRNALSYGWVDLKTLIGIGLKALEKEQGNRPPGPMGITPAVLFPALGIGGLKCAAFSAQPDPEGVMFQMYLGVPEAERKGLVKMFIADAKDSSPPPFVPADVTRFQRWRLDWQKAWTTLEETLNSINPQLLNAMTFFTAAIKQNNPDFDLRKNFIDNLGDDMISFDRAPRGPTLKDLNEQPSLYLFGSRNGEQLLASVRSLMAIVPQGGGGGRPGGGLKFKEREFQGRTIYSIPLPGGMGRPRRPGDPVDSDRELSLCASGGYIAISSDTAMLEEYLRSAGREGKTLRSLPGLAAASEKVGGMNTGLFGYNDDARQVKASIEMAKKDGNSIAELISQSPLGGRLGMEDGIKAFKEWFDFSLLPDWEKISKYFYFSVYAGTATPEGLTLKLFTPDPPQFRR